MRVTAFAPGEPVLEAARIGEVPGLAVMALVGVATVAVLAVAVWPIEREATGELRDPEEVGEWKE